MKFVVINAALLILLIVTVIFNWTAGRDFSKRNWVVFPEMMFSVPYDAYAANPNFSAGQATQNQGQTLQNPVAGTIARGFPPLHFEATPEDAIRAGIELTNPFSGEDQAVWERGRAVFGSFCTHCHGAGGEGDGTVSKRGFPPPPSLLAEKAMAMAEGQMFHVLTYGQGNMPGHAAQISREDRWKVIAYLTNALQSR